MAAAAFAALPERWRSILWHTEVEGQGPGELAAVLGIEAGAVAALACRAREGLRAAYLQAHVSEMGDAACRPYVLRLGVYARGRVGQREGSRLRDHLRRCAACARLHSMVRYVNEQLGASTRPITYRAGASRGASMVEASLRTMLGRCVGLLDVQAAGLMLMDHRRILSAAASSSENVRVLELFALQSDAGPCVEVCRTGVAVFNTDLRANRQRWPRFAAAAQAAGFVAVHALPLRRSETPVVNADLHANHDRWPQFAQAAESAGYISVHALPLRLRTTVIGALNLFCAHPSPLSEQDIRTGQALADVATIGILAQRTLHQAGLITIQLQGALNSRTTVEQAKGVLAERHHITVDAAFALLRDYADSHGMHLSEVCRIVVLDPTTATLPAEPAEQDRSTWFARHAPAHKHGNE
ncbi:ANTAR domain-containing protein [Actinocrinis sp.]|uniref:ANTAR domain-containing protein n=1 Tax=Actinocrinis sp. TaxID=1920516 RepID=UPI002D4DDE3A|nr:ANTAR domain-containing protein [Actinocrinis sp.]HZP51650.1 ANTAR domain-containing protein [Actinocrinis sp.]